MPDERIITSTYVMSVNGLTGNDYYELDGVEAIQDSDGDYKAIAKPSRSRNKHVIVDANDIRVTGSTGRTISQRFTQLESQIRPLLMEQIKGTDDYVMSLPNGYNITKTIQ